MNISHHLGQSPIITCFDITASTSMWQSKSSLNIRTVNIRDSLISPTLCRSVLSKWETRTVKMENDYTCKVCSVNKAVQSSFGLWMRWCVAIMALEQWPQGGRERRGKVINCLGVMEAEIGPSPSSRRAWLESGWIVSACRRWMALPWITHITSYWEPGQKNGRKWSTGVCARAIFSRNSLPNPVQYISLSWQSGSPLGVNMSLLKRCRCRRKM